MPIKFTAICSAGGVLSPPPPPHAVKNNVANPANVKKYREEKGLSQMQLALEIGMSGGAYLGRAELRKKNHHFNIRHIAKISKVLDVKIEDLFRNSHR